MGDHLEAKFAAVSARSRRLLIDAAVCFIATWLVAFLPPQWKNADALNEIVFTTDPVSGKIIDRIETVDTERASGRKSGAPALFAIYPQERISDWSNEYDPPNEPVAEKTETSLTKPTKVAALHKPSPEKRNPVESRPLAPPTNNAEPVAAQTMGDSADQPERSLLAKLDPTGLPSKLAPLGRKAWNNATALTGAVSSFVSAYRF